MQLKFGLTALSVFATIVLFGGDTVAAQSVTTDKKEVKKIVITVRAGDTLTSIAKKYKMSYTRLFNANKSIEHPDVIDVGDKIRIPAKQEKLENRLPQVAAIPAATSTASSDYQYSASAPRGSSAGNTYAWGYCTWYAKQMRPDLPNMLGNGGSWVANASAQGIPTGTTPRVGAIAEEPGHVAYVEAVSGGMITISEMNYNGGIGQVHRRTVPASNYRFIY